MAMRREILVGAACSAVTALAVVFVPLLSSASITLPHIFSNGTVADATQVNANFSVLKNAANGLDSRLAALESKVPSSCTDGQVLNWSTSTSSWTCGDAGVEAYPPVTGYNSGTVADESTCWYRGYCGAQGAALGRYSACTNVAGSGDCSLDCATTAPYPSAFHAHRGGLAPYSLLTVPYEMYNIPFQLICVD